MDVISFKEKPKTEIESSPMLSQFFGIINVGPVSKILIGPKDNAQSIMLSLRQQVEKLMENYNTELIVGEDTAVVYELIDNELIPREVVNLLEMLDEDEE